MPRRRRTALATACALAVLAAGCSSAAPEESPAPPTRTPPSASPASDVPRVDAPGPRNERLWSADVLVQWDQALPEKTVATIGRLRGVAHVERIGLGQVSVDGRVLTVAAVDPAAYRLFTRADVADLQEAWDRVAAGELALERRLATRIADEDGMVTLGAMKDAPVIHVGAHAPQVPTIDLVVNSAWAERIGMSVDNGLLISTGSVAPATIRKPLERLIGEHASVQMLDVASRLGLDPDAVLTAVPTGGTLSSLVGTFSYRVAGGSVVPDAGWVAQHIRTEQVPILGNVTCHKDLFPQLRAALLEVVTTGLADEINPDEFAGCYYPRFIANSTTLSNHAFGLALDVNVPGNLRGSVGEINRAVVDIFKKWGFAWGGDWRWTDPMHFELAEVRRPG
ncbi:MAG: M15 family metallopeptidase [Nocardioides sp.]|nr:M15 family metallopeptidase [Nocardioides sp.]